jgi:hypothetical protein
MSDDTPTPEEFDLEYLDGKSVVRGVAMRDGAAVHKALVNDSLRSATRTLRVNAVHCDENGKPLPFVDPAELAAKLSATATMKAVAAYVLDGAHLSSPPRPPASLLHRWLPVAVSVDAVANLDEAYDFWVGREGIAAARRLYRRQARWIVVGYWFDWSLKRAGSVAALLRLGA